MSALRKTTHFLKDDFSYKVVALLITLLIWLLVLGRAHQTETHEFDVTVQVSDSYEINSMRPETIRIKLKGPPKLMRKYLLETDQIMLPVKKAWEGNHRIKIKEHNLHLPFGLKLLSVVPRHIKVKLVRKKQEAKKSE